MFCEFEGRLEGFGGHGCSGLIEEHGSFDAILPCLRLFVLFEDGWGNAVPRTKEGLVFGGANDEAGTGGALFLQQAQGQLHQRGVGGVENHAVQAADVDDVGQLMAVEIDGHEEAAEFGQTGLEVTVRLRGFRPDAQAFLAGGLGCGHVARGARGAAFRRLLARSQWRCLARLRRGGKRIRRLSLVLAPGWEMGDVAGADGGAYWFRPEKRAGGGMPRMVRWPRKKSNQK